MQMITGLINPSTLGNCTRQNSQVDSFIWLSYRWWLHANPPINKTAPSLATVKETVSKLMDGKTAGINNISTEILKILKAGGEAMIRRMHGMLSAVWQFSAIPLDWRRGLLVHIWKGKRDRQNCNNYHGVKLCSVSGKVLDYLLLMRIQSHLLKYQKSEQSGFTPGKSTVDKILALRFLVELTWVLTGTPRSLCRYQEEFWLSASWVTPGHFAHPWDSCMDWWLAFILGLRVMWNVGDAFLAFSLLIRESRKGASFLQHFSTLAWVVTWSFLRSTFLCFP